ncbi:MAG: DUF5395 family protein [Pseudomonadota bacterium]|nr:DUF5395 family protein [Pseudomonadota bacterium]
MKIREQEIELQLSHNGEYWLAKSPFLNLQASTLSELENKIKKFCTSLIHKREKTSLKVHMRYNFDDFPKWLHQYHSHYFNRILIFSN